MRVKKLNRLIESIEGTCDSLDSVIEEIFGEGEDSATLDLEELEYIDDRIFECDCCGWWYAKCSESEFENRCEDCFEDEES